jgi:hypothetical protein
MLKTLSHFSVNVVDLKFGKLKNNSYICSMKTYNIKITYLTQDDIQPEIIQLTTDDIEWSMDQYQRNREPLKWEIVN